MSYQHGAGAEIGNDKVKSAVQVDTVVAYIGTAPINLVLGYKEKGLINTPIKLENMPKTQATVGYSSNWDKFTLCEPFDCHFANTIGNVGPIYIINVLDPAAVSYTHLSGSCKRMAEKNRGRVQNLGRKEKCLRRYWSK